MCRYQNELCRDCELFEIEMTIRLTEPKLMFEEIQREIDVALENDLYYVALIHGADITRHLRGHEFRRR